MERHTKEYRIKKDVLGFEMMAQVTQMPEEICVLLTGGSLPHTGSVSIYDKGKMLVGIVLEGHKDNHIGDLWAEEISLQRKCKVTVVCGIHYDHATKDMLQRIQKQAEQMLEEVLFHSNTASGIEGQTGGRVRNLQINAY